MIVDFQELITQKCLLQIIMIVVGLTEMHAHFTSLILSKSPSTQIK